MSRDFLITEMPVRHCRAMLLWEDLKLVCTKRQWLHGTFVTITNQMALQLQGNGSVNSRLPKSRLVKRFIYSSAQQKQSWSEQRFPLQRGRGTHSSSHCVQSHNLGHQVKEVTASPLCRLVAGDGWPALPIKGLAHLLFISGCKGQGEGTACTSESLCWGVD